MDYAGQAVLYMASLPLGVNILNQASPPIGGPATRQAERADTDGNYHAVRGSGMRLETVVHMTDLEGIRLNSACYAHSCRRVVYRSCQLGPYQAHAPSSKLHYTVRARCL